MKQLDVGAALAALAITPQETTMSETETTDTTKQWNQFLEKVAPLLSDTQPVAFGVVLALRETHEGQPRVRTHALARLPDITDPKDMNEFAVLMSRSFSGAVASDVGRIAATAAHAAITAADDAPKSE